MTDKVQLIKEEIERQIELGKTKCQESQENNDQESHIAWSEHVATCGKLLLFIDSLPEESIREDLEEEIDRVYKSRNDLMMTRRQFGDLIHHFAELQEQQMKEALQTEYEKGRFDMREEMMKDAVECIVHQCEVDDIKLDGVEILSDGLTLDEKIYKDADKVKIIIVKE